MGYSFRLAARVLSYAPSNKQEDKLMMMMMMIMMVLIIIQMIRNDGKHLNVCNRYGLVDLSGVEDTRSGNHG